MKTEILKSLFKSIENKKYIIVKSFDFLNLDDGIDIDIYCYSIFEIRDHIIKSFLEMNLGKDYSFKVKNLDSQLHLDLIFNRKLLIRFDLYEKIPKFKKVLVRESLFDILVETRQKHNIDGIIFFKANTPFNDMLRYIEYVEYFSLENNKIKHLDYLEKNLKSHESFYNLVHYYIKFNFDKHSKKRRFNIEDLNIILAKVRQTPLNKLPQKAYNFFFK